MNSIFIEVIHLIHLLFNELVCVYNVFIKISKFFKFRTFSNFPIFSKKTLENFLFMLSQRFITTPIFQQFQFIFNVFLHSPCCSFSFFYFFINPQKNTNCNKSKNCHCNHVESCFFGKNKLHQKENPHKNHDNNGNNNSNNLSNFFHSLGKFGLLNFIDPQKTLNRKIDNIC